RERHVGDVQVVGRDAVLGLEPPGDGDGEPGVEEGRDDPAVNRPEGAHHGVGHLHYEHRAVLVRLLDAEAEQLPEARRRRRRGDPRWPWCAKRPAESALPPPRWGAPSPKT